MAVWSIAGRSPSSGRSPLQLRGEGQAAVPRGVEVRLDAEVSRASLNVSWRSSNSAAGCAAIGQADWGAPAELAGGLDGGAGLVGRRPGALAGLEGQHERDLGGLLGT
jgi:hypothetical protein